MRSACDTEQPIKVSKGLSRSVKGSGAKRDKAHLPSSATCCLVVRGGVELPTFRFSGVAGGQLRPDAREYVAVHGCVRALTTAVVAVMVAVGDTSGLSASQVRSQARCPAPAPARRPKIAQLPARST